METQNLEKRPNGHVEKTPATLNWYRPPVDVYEADDGLVLVLDVPGVKPAALEVNVEGRILTVQGVRAHGRSGWRRSFTLPDGFDTDKIAAKAENGVLRLDVPRAETAKPRKISVT